MFCGIDPGKSGAIAIVDEFGEIVSTCAKMPWENDRLDARKVQQILVPWASKGGLKVTIEKVAGYGMGAKSCFTFGKSVGGLFAVLDILGVSIVHPTPQIWQKVMLAGYPKGDTKEASRQAAYDLFPGLRDGRLSLKSSHNLSDAALIAEYGRRTTSEKINHAE